MAEFNYTEYLKNNPLLQEEVKEKLLTESQEVSEEAPSSKTTVSELKAQIKEMINAALQEDITNEAMGKYVQPLYDIVDERSHEHVVDELAYYMDVDQIKEFTDWMRDRMERGLAEAEVEEPINEGPSTEEKRIAMMAAKKQAKFRDVSLEQAIQDQINALEALKREMNEEINEQDEDEDVEVDIEDEIEADVEPTMDAEPEVGGSEGLTADEKEIQDSLKLAYDNAVAIGDQKLADQIGNSITFFTRTHVVER